MQVRDIKVIIYCNKQKVLKLCIQCKCDTVIKCSQVLISEQNIIKYKKILLLIIFLQKLPISTKEIVFGKYLAAFGIFMVGVLITLIYPVILAFTGNLPIAETISCYVGFILLCSAILAIGAFMSSITESQIVAAVATYGVLIFTLLLGSVASNVSNEIIVKILLWLSPVQRFSDFTLGILNFEPIIYYLSITSLFLFFTVMVFERRRMR